MKFKTNIDEIYFNVTNQNENVIRNKFLLLVKNIKDRKKSKNVRDFWRRNAYKMKKALKKWHSSTQGKRFHRNLGNFLATHLLKKDIDLKVDKDKNEVLVDVKEINLSMEESINILIGLNNIKTHLIIELQYFERDIEALEEFLIVYFQFLEDVYEIEVQLLKSYLTGKMEIETLKKIVEIFLFFIDDKYFLYATREKFNLSNDKNVDESIKEDINKLKEKLENIDFIRSYYER